MMKKKARGFTLLEVLAATAVLSVGTLYMYQSYFSVLRAFDYCSGYIASSNFLQEKLWEGVDSVRREGGLGSPVSGDFTAGGRQFVWNMALGKASDRVYEVTVAVDWKSGKQEIELSRTAYASYENPTE